MNLRLLAKIVLGVAVTILIIAFIINIASGPSDSPTVNGPIVEESIFEDINNSRVRYTLSGPIVAREEYREIRITVDKDTRVIEVIRGYNNNVIDRKTFSNDTNAYRAFIAGLDSEGFLNSKEGTADSPFAACPEGKRRIVEYFVSGELESNLFATSCSSRHGTLAGDSRDIEDLFEDQIPDYRDFIREHKF